MEKVTVIGAGLAGSEAAFYLAEHGVKVTLYEMRPKTYTEAHKTDQFAELVCSNSLRSNLHSSAVGILKDELRMQNSLIIQSADKYQVPAGGALAVDRDLFSGFITDTLKNHTNIDIIHEEVKDIPKGPVIIATGPLSTQDLLDNILERMGEETLHFYDAAAPIIDKDSINMDICYKKSRYDKGTADYINCPMNEEQYNRFYDALTKGKTTKIRDFELKVFEACMPVEVMAERGKQTLLFGPLKPVGLNHNGQKFHAVVQLRQDDIRASMYNMVGFQTHLTYGEQKRIFRMIPGLENAEFLRYGIMHRNSFLKSPTNLTANYRLKGDQPLYIAGQLTGVEGYVESTSSGLVAARSMLRELEGKETVFFPKETITGSLSDYIAHANKETFQPMHVTFGLLPELGFKHKKKERKSLYANRALETMSQFLKTLDDK